MQLRSLSGRSVVIALLVLAIGGAVALNLATRGTPQLPRGTRVFLTPTSHRASLGVTYPARLLARCAPVVDFDGDFWQPPGGWTLAQPAEPATIRLAGPDRAVLRTASGQSLPLVRAVPPVGIASCSP